MGWWPFKKKSAPGAGEVIDTPQKLAEYLTAGNESLAGVQVTPRTALEISTALQCVRVLCNGVSLVPFRLYRRVGRNNIKAEDHPIYRLVYRRPNEWQTSFDFRTMIMMHLTLTGNAYIWINRVMGEVVELLPYPPGTVTVQQEGFGKRYWITTQNGKQQEIPAADMWHLTNLAWELNSGLGVVRAAREVLGLAKATEIYGAKLFKNGGRPAGILYTPATLNEEQRKGLREDWERMNATLTNANRTAILWGDLKYMSLAPNNDEAQFLETRKFTVEEICRVFGVAPIKVYHSDKASTYASAEQMGIAHVTDTLMPIYENVEQSADIKLLSDEEQKEGYYFKLEAKGLLRGAIKDRGDFYTKMFGVGAMSPNDIRECEDLNPYEGGDYYFVPMNMQTPDAASQPDEDEDKEAAGSQPAKEEDNEQNK